MSVSGAWGRRIQTLRGGHNLGTVSIPQDGSRLPRGYDAVTDVTRLPKTALAESASKLQFEFSAKARLRVVSACTNVRVLRSDSELFKRIGRR